MKTFQVLWHFLTSGRRLEGRQEGTEEGRKEELLLAWSLQSTLMEHN